VLAASDVIEFIAEIAIVIDSRKLNEKLAEGEEREEESGIAKGRRVPACCDEGGGFSVCGQSENRASGAEQVARRILRLCSGAIRRAAIRMQNAGLTLREGSHGKGRRYKIQILPGVN
jgi:hypothetical protein